MKVLLLLFVLLCRIPSCCAQFNPIWERSKTNTDCVWQVSKTVGLTSAVADTVTTVQAIERGYIESNKIHNLFIDRTNSAPVRRSIILIGQAYTANLILNYVYRRTSSKKWHWVIIGIRNALTIDSTRCAIHNSSL